MDVFTLSEVRSLMILAALLGVLAGISIVAAMWVHAENKRVQRFTEEHK